MSYVLLRGAKSSAICETKYFLNSATPFFLNAASIFLFLRNEFLNHKL